MEYTVKALADLAGVSRRTLRYYDQIGLLAPARINSSGYRIYGRAEVDRLQLILFYRTLGIALDEIGKIIDDPEFDAAEALRAHHAALLEERRALDRLIRNVERTIEAKEGGIHMRDREKFEGLKQRKLEENEAQYGAEIREKYGEDTVRASNEKWMGMSSDDYDRMTAIEAELKEVLKAAVDAPSEAHARKAAQLHKEWLMYTWNEYSKEAHQGLAEMYVTDARFRKYYDDVAPGAAEFLRAAIVQHAE
ncbi:MerR family transcriptional regulator [Salinicoccus luteus]|uniref:MerR family transcriptional regulator n=1 Tax=Salinicoccus luteus TaxID=367840 RepID=UPI0004E24E2B|nr:MerR family transcriptional regulator [Salinicoccus luteus]